MNTLPFPSEKKPSSLVIGEPWAIEGVFGPRRLARLARSTTFVSEPISPQDWPSVKTRMGDVEVIFGTWNLPAFSVDDANLLRALRAVFYSAGTVHYFAPPLLGRGVEVFSAAAANAIPVAEFTLGQILLANKGYFRLSRAYTAGHDAAPGFGNFGATVALLGAGEVGRALIERLKPFALRVMVFDPFLREETAAVLGVEKVSIEKAFACAHVVSNHLADLPATKGMLRGFHFDSMPRDATFLNTGRGATVHESELIEVLRARPDLTALLDVTDPEPVGLASPLRFLPNVHLSPHLAGSIGVERERLADWMLAEFDAWSARGEARGKVTSESLASMA